MVGKVCFKVALYCSSFVKFALLFLIFKFYIKKMIVTIRKVIIKIIRIVILASMKKKSNLRIQMGQLLLRDGCPLLVCVYYNYHIGSDKVRLTIIFCSTVLRPVFLITVDLMPSTLV